MKVNRIARITLDIAFLLLVIMPLVVYAFSYFCDNPNNPCVGYTFDEFLEFKFNVEYSENLSPIFRYLNVEQNDNYSIIYYLIYLIQCVYYWVIANVILFIPMLCVKFMRRFIS